MVAGAIAALKAQGIDPKPLFITSIGNTKLGNPLVIDGELDGTVFQSSSWDGENAINVAADVLNGDEVEEDSAAQPAPPAHGAPRTQSGSERAVSRRSAPARLRPRGLAVRFLGASGRSGVAQGARRLARSIREARFGLAGSSA
jgi:hypothetical protein